MPAVNGNLGLSHAALCRLVTRGRSRRIAQVLCITAAVVAASWLAVGGTLLALAPAVPFLRSLAPHELWAVASLGGTLAMARSPASAVGVST